MAKQIETIIWTDCSYCGVKILRTFVSDKKKTPEEIAKLERLIRDDHIRLHEESNKYDQLSGYVRRMAEITGDLKYDT